MACKTPKTMGRLDHVATPSAAAYKSKAATPVNGCVTPGRHDVATGSITSPAEMFRTDLITAMKKPDSDVIADSDYAVIDDTWKPEWEKGVQVCVKQDGLARSLAVKKGASFECPKKFSPPAPYVDATVGMDLRATVERSLYDMDNQDAQWLARVRSMDMKGACDIDEEKFEACISFLDMKCHETMCDVIKTDDGLGMEYDADVNCAVCRELDSEDGNEMVFCDKCNICVHQACYGISQIPSGKWFCSPCSINLKPTCVLCGQEGGALKPVRLGARWAHISCALWIPEVKIANVEAMEPVSNFHSIPQSRWNLLCSLCRIRRGACIQCFVPTCTVAFHVECAFQQSLKMKCRIDQAISDGVRNEAYCARHAQLATSPGPGLATQATPQVNQRERRLNAMMEEFHQYARHTDLARKYRFAKPLALAIHSYWVIKRRMHGNKSFLSLPDPWQVVAEERLKEFQEEKERDEAKDQSRPMCAEWELEWERFTILRQDMEKSRNLSYMLVRRERWKRQLLDVQRDTFLKAAELALTSDDSQDIGLAGTVVNSLHPRPTHLAEAQSVSSPGPRSLRSVSSSPIKSPAPYLGAELPAKRLRSASMPSDIGTPARSLSPSVFLEQENLPSAKLVATSAASFADLPDLLVTPSRKDSVPDGSASAGRRNSAAPSSRRTLRSRSEFGSSTSREASLSPTTIMPTKRRHSSRR